MIKAGEKVHVKFAGLSFTGKVTRVGADKGEKTKLQIQNDEGGKPLWYPISSVTSLDASNEQDEKVYVFTFAGAKKKGTVVSKLDNGKVRMKSVIKKEGEYTVKESDVEWNDEKPSDFEKAIDESIERNKEPEQPDNEMIAGAINNLKEEPKKVKATELGEAIVGYLQKNTKKGEDVDCRTIDEIADAVGKTQPQIKAALNALNELELVLVGVCNDNPNTAALTPDGFSYQCGEPSGLKKLNKNGKKVTKKERIIALYHQGLTNKEIIEQVGCDPSYPGWLIREEIAKGNIKERK